MNLEILGVLSTLIGLLSAFAGGIAYYRSTVRKEYASERDFGHLKNNYRQLSEFVSSIDSRILEISKMIDSQRLHLNRIEFLQEQINQNLFECKVRLSLEKEDDFQ